MPERHIIQIKTLEKKTRLVVGTWNMLAIKYATPEAFPHVDPDVLTYHHRYTMLIDEISRAAPDILCIQEFDFPMIMASDKLRKFELIDGSNATTDTRWNGLAIIYNPEKLRKNSVRLFALDAPNGSGMPPVRMMEATFWVKETEQLVQVVNVHLKSKVKFEAQRVEQIKHVLATCSSPICEALILAGDFNAKPTSDSVQSVINSKIFKEAHDDTECDILKSQAVTSAKMRDDATYMISDYIFYRPMMLTPVAYMDRFEPKALSEHLLPHKTYPSDHLLIAAEFEL